MLLECFSQGKCRSDHFEHLVLGRILIPNQCSGKRVWRSTLEFWLLASWNTIIKFQGWLVKKLCTFLGKTLHDWVMKDFIHYWYFVAGSSIQAQSRVDLCQMLFNSTMTTQFVALSQHIEPPGIAVYSSGMCAITTIWRNMNMIWVEMLCYKCLVML
jgi:hypothetical protein